MADIIDAAAIKFANEQVRPLAEQARALKARITSMTNDWFGGLNTKFPNDSSIVADGRIDGANVLTGADINNLVGNLISAHDAMNDQIVGKPCVRPLQVSTQSISL